MSDQSTRDEDRIARHWNALFRREDPWNYASEYEQLKYRHTLELLPPGGIVRALELGCAEGRFSEMLAPRVTSLLAVDVADKALQRAGQRCADAGNVQFLQHDISRGLPAGEFDLIVCSEILYYLQDQVELAFVAAEMVNAIKPGGCLLMTHANMVSDDRSVTGFDFNEIGAKFIGELFADLEALEFECELRTELYRVQLFRKLVGEAAGTAEASCDAQPEKVLLREHAEFHHPQIKWGGCEVTGAEARFCFVSEQVPVLMYHRVTDHGPDELAPYRVGPEAFERQLAWLQRHGYHGIRLSDYWRNFYRDGTTSMPGKPVVLTFDDAYRDFCGNAHPILSKFGFPATVFVPTGHVGQAAAWDSEFGEPAPLMDWDEIVGLSKRGVDFGSHSCAHRKLNELDDERARREMVDSKAMLEARLGSPVTGFCYPYTVTNGRLQTLAGEAGYDYAVSGKHGALPPDGNAYDIRRIEILGSDSLEAFIAKLPPPQPSGDERIAEFRELKARRDRRTYMKL